MNSNYKLTHRQGSLWLEKGDVVDITNNYLVKIRGTTYYTIPGFEQVKTIRIISNERNTSKPNTINQKKEAAKWREKWRRLTTGQKIFGTIVCLCIGVMLFAATVWLKIQLNPVSFTQNEYYWIRGEVFTDPAAGGTYTLTGIRLVKDGKPFGASWATLTVTKDDTILVVSQALYTEMPYLTEITITDRDLDGLPDDIFFRSYKEQELTGFDNPPVDKDVITQWDVWLIRFIEAREAERVREMSTLR
ncbi:unnamed protein product [marine sediment metagenome]|uniref:Uncharacterized protein n=1 Tax=marine sediment metagenome TaxID=412755 RepID=X1AUV2_9ZZZZ